MFETEVIDGKVYFQGYLVAELVEGAPASVLDWFETNLTAEPAYEDEWY